MTDVEKIREIFEEYYKRDGNGKVDDSNFFVEVGDEKMNSFYKAIPELEEKTGKKFPEQYKAFIQAGCGWTISSKEGTIFSAYLANDILYFHNYYEKNKRDNQTFAKCLIIGQDCCDGIYFMDVNNVLGHGADCVWKSGLVFNKSLCDIYGNNFIEFLENMAFQEKIPIKTPFFRKPQINDYSPEEEPLTILENQIKQDPKLFEKTENDKRYVDEILSKLELENKGKKYCECRINYRRLSIDIKASLRGLENVKTRFKNQIPLEFLSLYAHLKENFSMENKDVDIMISLRGNDDIYDEDEYVSDYLKKMLIIGTIEGKTMEQIIDSDKGWPMLFMDVDNLLGYGNQVIYEIPLYAKTIGEACIIASDYKDLVRKIYEDEPFDLTPIGKVK